MSDQNINDPMEGFDVAIIGMAGRFPGAKNIDTFWENLRDDVESITLFTDEQMKAMGVDAAALRDPSFVKAGALLEDIDLFDAPLFGYSPREAEMIDPQQRVFLECAWEALENAGYNAEAYEGMIGVYAGASMSTYLLYNVLGNSVDSREGFQAMIGNDKDFLSTRVSYELNLKGPSINVQTACSTSLVAAHLAYQGLLAYQCDMALAGGVSIQVPQRTGYYYQEGGVNSPDGHCRTFDAQAAGTVFGSGVGIVVMKRLADALADGDSIHAIIKGSAINNDGSTKVGYTAPSLDGQAQVVALAQLTAGVEAESISYIEAHGTATALGDPVEISALTKAFRGSTKAKNFCALGSVKTNVGHLDAAAGVTGLIKTVLALKNKLLPPSLHFNEPNPRIDFEDSPFYVNSKLREWDAGATPRRAGVSSFGIGGTNAHVVVEEAPPAESSGESRSWQVLMLSARTSSALEAATCNLATRLRQRPEANLADAAYTLQVGRKVFKHRRAVICQNAQDAVTALETLDAKRVFTVYQEPQDRPIVFMFPGGGAQYVNMGLDLYREEPIFRAHVEECSEILKSYTGYDLRDRLYPSQYEAERSSEQMRQTSLGLPALFTVEYALAKLWMNWGIRPHAMIGHSLGEYVAACLAGVFSLEDALSLVTLRAELFERLPRGGMLSVPLAEREARLLMDQRLSIAANNAPSQCVVSGPVEAIEDMAKKLASKEVEFRRIQIDVAAHSQMVTPMLAEFTRFVESLELNPPTTAYVSNVTGTWITEAQATDPSYWQRHLRQTVKFADGLEELFKEPGCLLLEVGPGQTLSTLAKMQSDNSRAQSVFASMRHPYDRQSDIAVLITTLGRMWLSGAEIKWEGFHAGQSRKRIALPTHPFERQRYWIEPASRGFASSDRAGAAKRSEISEWFYIPGWKKKLAPGVGKQARQEARNRKWLMLMEAGGVMDEVCRRMEAKGEEIITVRMGEKWERVTEREYEIDGRSREDYERMIEEVRAEGEMRIVHGWSMNVEGEEEEGDKELFEREQRRGFYSLLFLVQALEKNGVDEPVRISVITNNTQEVESRDLLRPEKATIIGPCKVIPQEYENISIKLIDIAGDAPASQRETLIDQLFAEVCSDSASEVIAYRGANRWVQTYEPARLSDESEPINPLRENGVYLITGGLGGIGLHLAEYLVRKARARLILTRRSYFPRRGEWDTWLETHDETDETSVKIRKLKALEKTGAEILTLTADVADEEQMRFVIRETISRFGEIHTVIHAAGIAGEKAIKLITQVEAEDCEMQFQSKVYGLYVLEKVLAEHGIDSCLLFSSNASILGGLGSLTYSAANLFMDAFALNRSKRNGARWISANWDGWLLSDEGRLASAFQTSMDQYAMSSKESVEAFERVMSLMPSGQVIVSTGDLETRLNLWVNLKGRNEAGSANNGGPPPPLHARPALGTAYVPPQSDLERHIANIWQELLGVEQLGVNDNFFDLGGNSLISLKVISRLKKELNVEIPVVAIFEGPTVSALSRVISQNPDEKVSYVESRGRGERRREKRKQKYGND